MKKRLAELKNREDGFTLIELMVVVLIIGILVAIAVPKFLNAQNGAKAKAAQSNARAAEAVMQTVFTDKGTYALVDWASLKAADSMFTPLDSSDTTANPSTGPSQVSWKHTTTAAVVSPARAASSGISIAVQGKDNICYVIDNDTVDGTTFGLYQVGATSFPTTCVAGSRATATYKFGLVADVSTGWTAP